MSSTSRSTTGQRLQRRNRAALRFYRPRPERLEDRRLLTAGTFFEDFTRDTDLVFNPPPTWQFTPAWDTFDTDPTTIPGGDADNDPLTTLGPDELLIRNDFPFPTVTNGPTRTGGYAVIVANPSAPVGPNILALTSGEGQIATMIFDFPNPGDPGGFARDEEVAIANIDVRGFGEVTFVGQNASLVFNVSTRDPASGQLLWTQLSAARESLVQQGNQFVQLGAIQQIMVRVSSRFDINRIGVLVFPQPTPQSNVIANDDYGIVSQRQQIPVLHIDWRRNDVALDNSPLTLVNFTQPLHGSVSMDNASGTGNYEPFAGFFGRDSFEYTLTDGQGNTDRANVILDVVNNLPPVAMGRQFSVPRGLPGPLREKLSYTDPDADLAIVAALAPAPGESHIVFPQHGQVGFVVSGGQITFEYQPTSGALTTSDRFYFSVSDAMAGVSEPALVEITPITPPTGDSFVMAAAHGDPTPLRGSFPFTAADPEQWVAILLQDGEHGRVTKLQVVPGGRVEVEYQTPSGAIGSDRFSYYLTDGVRASALTTVEIRVPNYAPIAIADHIQVKQDEYIGDPSRPVVSTVYGKQSRNDSELGDTKAFYRVSLPLVGNNEQTYGQYDIDDFDLDGDPLSFELHQPQFGTVVSFDSATGQFNYLPPQPLLFPQIDVATGEILTDIHDEDFDGDIAEEAPWLPFGYDWFEYEVSDGYSVSHSVVIIEFQFIVTGTIDRAYEVFAGETLSVPGEQGLDSYPAEGQTLYLVRGPEHGSLDIIPGGNGAFVYRANSDFVGVDSALYLFELNLFTGPNQLTAHAFALPTAVDFIVRNLPPEPLPDHYYAAAGKVLDISPLQSVLVNDHDFNGHALRVDLFTDPPHGTIVEWSQDGSFRYQPDDGFAGPDSFEYQVSDGFGGATRETIIIDVISSAVAGDVANILTPGGDAVALLSSPGTTLENVQVSATPPAIPPGYVQLPLGYFNFEIHGLPLGGSASVRLILPAGAPELNQYWKYGPTFGDANDHWYSFPADFSQPGQIVLSFYDGDLGDTLEVDGVIRDPGGPAFVNLPPRVESVRINDGASQRSKVNSLTVTFDALLTIAPGAFELYQRGVNKPLPLQMALSETNGRTVARLMFKGRRVVGGSLPDGNYRLVIRGDKIRDAAARRLDGDSDGTEGGNRVDEFFRLFGDTDGDGDVDRLDMAVFESAFGKRSGQPGYLWYLDANANSRIWAEDLVFFQLHYGHRVKRG